MPARQITPMSVVMAILQNRRNDSEEKVISKLIQIGESGLQEAISGGNYQNRTSNLRNSLGFVVARNGHIEHISPFNSTEGGKNGEHLARKLAASSKGIVLYMVAGQFYSKYVAAKGFNVIDSADLIIERLLTQLGFARI